MRRRKQHSTLRVSSEPGPSEEGDEEYKSGLMLTRISDLSLAY